MTNVRPETRRLQCRNATPPPGPRQHICLPNHQMTLTSLLHSVLDHTIAVHLGRLPPAHVFTLLALLVDLLPSDLDVCSKEVE